MTQIHEVNILVLYEGGLPQFLLGFNASYQRTLIIAYRYANKKGPDRNHYDSVVRIDDTDLFKMAKMLSETATIHRPDKDIESISDE